MPSILICQSMRQYAGRNVQPLTEWIAGFFAKAGFSVTQESQCSQWQQWLDYDAVFVCFELYDADNLYHWHVLKQLRQSMLAMQPRFCHDDDASFKPLSLLRQIGEPDVVTVRGHEVPEFTHKLMLNRNMQRTTEFSKFAHWESTSVDTAVVMRTPHWTVPPAYLSSLANRDVLALNPSCYYAGYPKGDRLQLMAQLPSELLCYGGRQSYLLYLVQTSSCLANCMMNSTSHAGQPTPRFYESAALSVQLWPASVNVVGYEPPANRVFSNAAELRSILHELAAQTPEQRATELQLQLHNAHRLLNDSFRHWATSSELARLHDEVTGGY